MIVIACGKRLAIFVLLFFVSVPVSATTLDFEAGIYDLTGPAQVYSEAGYSFTTPEGNHFDSNDSPLNSVFPGGLPHLVFHEAANNPLNNVVTLTFEGGLFDLLGFDLVFNQAVKNRNPAINPTMTILGSGGETMQSPSNGFIGTVLTPGFRSVNSVTFDINFNSVFAGNVILDNVQVRAAGPNPPSVPLPMPALLMLSSFGVFGVLRTQRKTAARARRD